MPKKQDLNPEIIKQDAKREVQKAKSEYKIQAEAIADVIQLHKHGYSIKKIGKLLNIPPLRVHKYLNNYKTLVGDNDQLEVVKSQKSDILHSLQGLVLKSLASKAEFENANPSQLGYLLDVLARNQRLVDGESTSNVSIQVTARTTDHLDRR